MTLANYYLERLQAHQIFSLAEFVVSENFSHHTSNCQPTGFMDEVYSIHDEEASFYNDSEIFVFRDILGSIQGTIRVLNWNYQSSLPLQKIFDINPLSVFNHSEINNIYHIGRFAIRKAIRNIHLLKQLMICAISPICHNSNNVGFAECDSKLLRVLSLMGIDCQVLGDSRDYLGSETIPIALTYDGLIGFYNQNKSLLDKVYQHDKRRNEYYHLPN